MTKLGARRRRIATAAARTQARPGPRLIEDPHPVGGQVMGSVEFFQPCARAVLPELFVFALAETKEAHCISEHDPLNLSVIVSHGLQEKDHHVWKRFGMRAIWESALPAQSSTSRCHRG